MRVGFALIGFLAAVAFAAAPSAARDATEHGKTKSRASASASSQTQAVTPAAKDFGINVGAPFALVDHLGKPRTDRDYHGGYLLVFFGYAKCESICPVGLKRMTDAVDLLGEAGAAITPILITVDPRRDSSDVLAAEVAEIHPRLIGLTGTEVALAAVRKGYNVSVKAVDGNWGEDAVLAHGSFIYLMGKQDQFLTLLPPVFAADKMAETIRKYLAANAS